MELQCKRADDLTKEINTLIKDMKASGSMTNYMRSGLDKTRKVDSKSERMRVLILFLKKEGEYVPDFSILTNNIDMYLEGFKYTVMSSVIALIGSFILE